MLVISRREHERLVVRVPPGVSEEIQVVVAKLRGGQVRIGIEAAEHVEVVRGELVDAEARHDGGDQAA